MISSGEVHMRTDRLNGHATSLVNAVGLLVTIVAVKLLVLCVIGFITLL